MARPTSRARRRGAEWPDFRTEWIYDAKRVRALKIYKRHMQANAIYFIDYVVKKFPFRIRTIHTDRGHEFQALFLWHVADLGMEHVYIEPCTPQLNSKGEKLAGWERFYNFDRPHGAHGGKTPYEALREELPS